MNKKFKKFKNTVQLAYVIEELNAKNKLLERFTKKNCERQIKQSLEFKK